MRKEAQHAEPGGTFSYSTSASTSITQYKQGGTIVHVRKKWSSRITKAKDPLGIWSSITLTGKENLKNHYNISILSMQEYRVISRSKHSVDAGIYTATGELQGTKLTDFNVGSIEYRNQEAM